MKSFSFALLTAGGLSLSMAQGASAAIVYEADFNTDAGGWVDFQNRGSGAVAGGTFSGGAVTSSDVQLRTDFSLDIAEAALGSEQLFVRWRETDTNGIFLNASNSSQSNRAFFGDVPYAAGAGNATGTNVPIELVSFVDDTDNYIIGTWNLGTSFAARPASANNDGDLDSLRFDPTTSPTAVNPNVTWDVDYIRIGVVPEPASMALLGLGGLAMLGRRHK